MRTAFIKKLVELAEVDSEIYLIIGDYGYSVVELFRDKFPDRFINAGISEQGMIGIAAGLALAGKKVFVYSIVPFVTMRCFEQVRIDLCYQNLPVRVVGIAAGLAFGPAATTHHSMEDLALMCSLPNMTVVSPANSFDVQELLPQINKLPGPVYLRLGRGGPGMAYPVGLLDPVRPDSARPELVEGVEGSQERGYQRGIKFGQPVEVVPSNKNLFLVTGDMFSVAFDVVKKLRELGIDCGLVNMHTIKPLSLEFILSKVNLLQAVFTLEEHGAIGGLGQQVAAFLCQNLNKKVLFKSFCLPDVYFHRIGSRDYLLKKVGLDAESICADVVQYLAIPVQNNYLSQAKF